jgi:ParB-like chromosome segregation protein Spo0J
MVKIQLVRLSELKVNQSILVVDSKMRKYYSSLKKHIKKNGIDEPIIVDQTTKIIIDGHLRFKILLELGIKAVAVMFVKSQTIQQHSLPTEVPHLKVA